MEQDANLRPRTRPQQVSFIEHSASDGINTINLLRFIGALCLVAGIAVGILMIVASHNAKLDGSTSTLYMLGGIAGLIQGVTYCALFFVISLIAENLVAIRKNTGHLAGIRSNTAKELQMISRQAE